MSNAHRKADFRKGIRLGKDDHIVRWNKPNSIRSIDWKTYHTLPKSIVVREVRVHVKQPGFRTRVFVVVTTLLNPEEFSKEDLAALYRDRWNNELDLRSLKQTMQMDVLRCKTPELIRKEVWTHILAYNLIRTVMAQAATRHHMKPRSVSFKGAVQTLEAFQPLIAIQGEKNSVNRVKIYEQLLDALAKHEVADRPNRFEPRPKKRRPNHYGYLRKTRAQTKREMRKRVT